MCGFDSIPFFKYFMNVRPFNEMSQGNERKCALSIDAYHGPNNYNAFNWKLHGINSFVWFRMRCVAMWLVHCQSHTKMYSDFN